MSLTRISQRKTKKHSPQVPGKQPKWTLQAFYGFEATKKDGPINHQTTRLFGLEPVCHFYETHKLYKQKALRELFQK